MMRLLLFFVAISGILFSAAAQIIVPDFRVNDADQNLQGVGRTAVAAAANGNYAIAWQDFNEYNQPVTEIPRVAVQMFAADGNPIGPLNLFRGESRNLSVWTSDFLTGNIDLVFLPDGTLLVGVEHQGDLSVAGDFVFSSETGIGVVSAQGQIVDANNTSGVIGWLIATELDDEKNLRLAATPSGEFFAVVFGPTFSTNFNAVAIQAFDENGNFVGDFFYPHSDDPGPNSHHLIPDIATNGTLHLVVWQDGRQDANFDISGQFYNDNGAIGGNFKINNGDAPGTINVAPSVAMNANGDIVVVWADTRTGASGEIFGQRFNAAGQTVGGNFQVSAGDGEIWDRPEVAVRSDGSFMVVWTDSITALAGTAALRARARQFDPAGNPLGATFLLPNQDVPSGLANIATDGTYYYCAWVDGRDGGNINIYAKIIGNMVNSVEAVSDGQIPRAFYLAQNYPNPFNPSTTIEFGVPNRARIRLAVYDLLGKEVALLIHETLSPGTYQTGFSGYGLPSGLYVYQMEAQPLSGESRQLHRITQKMMLLK